MKCPYCAFHVPEKIREPSIIELAQNDIKLGNENFSFEAGDLDFYFCNQSRIPYSLLTKLREIKETQGI